VTGRCEAEARWVRCSAGESQLPVVGAVAVDTVERRGESSVEKRGGAQRWERGSAPVGLRCSLKRRRRWKAQGT
jgi:hypothetical protein